MNQNTWTEKDETLDLHGRTVEEAKQVVDNMLNYCSIRGIRQVTIVYGKGSGRLREEVGPYLLEHPLVELMRYHTLGTDAWVVEVMDCRLD